MRSGPREFETFNKNGAMMRRNTKKKVIKTELVRKKAKPKIGTIFSKYVTECENVLFIVTDKKLKNGGYDDEYGEYDDEDHMLFEYDGKTVSTRDPFPTEALFFISNDAMKAYIKERFNKGLPEYIKLYKLETHDELNWVMTPLEVKIVHEVQVL